MKRGPRRQRSNGFLIHEGRDEEGARWVGQRYMVGGGAVRAMHGQAWEGTFVRLASPFSGAPWQERLSSCGDRIPRRPPHRRVTFGIIILLSASSSPSPARRPMGHALLSRWDELAFCSNRFRPCSTSSFHSFQIHRIFTPQGS